MKMLQVRTSGEWRTIERGSQAWLLKTVRALRVSGETRVLRIAQGTKVVYDADTGNRIDSSTEA